MNASQKKKAGCTGCAEFHKANPDVFPMGTCLKPEKGATDIRKLQSCPKTWPQMQHE